MNAWQHILTRYIRPAPMEFALGALCLASGTTSLLGLIILGWPFETAALVLAATGGYMLRGNAWKARALEAEAEREEATDGH